MAAIAGRFAPLFHDPPYSVQVDAGERGVVLKMKILGKMTTVAIRTLPAGRMIVGG
jgi:hypothetical protein